MFYTSLSRHLFDTMFAILCVVAGANSHSLSNSNRTVATDQTPSRQRTSFMDLLFDVAASSRVPNKYSTGKFESMNATLSSSNHSSTGYNRRHHEADDLCFSLNNILTSGQFRLCKRHRDIFTVVLPEVIHLSRNQCAEITSDLRWNCPSIEPMLDRSNYLALTKEAALIRSIMSASMMYLILKLCHEKSELSCGCRLDRHVVNYIVRTKPGKEVDKLHTDPEVSRMALSQTDLRLLHGGATVRLSRSTTWNQGCQANVAFADALTRVFLDSDDNRYLNKEFKILNENLGDQINPNPTFNDKLQIDPDYRELSMIKWTKSAINLHNNHFGRQVVREAIRKECRCHGISGACQYQTCWDRLSTLGSISSRLRSAYLRDAIQVGFRNLGTLNEPDLYLVKSIRSLNSGVVDHIKSDSSTPQPNILSINDLQQSRVKSSELLYLYESPNYCDSQPNSNFTGTRGRQCSLLKGNSIRKQRSDMGGAQDVQEIFSVLGALGSCEGLCCNRGVRNELALTLIRCNCRFKFCCHVECDTCLRQQQLHYCF